ncbi:DinB family protein [Deinococcus sp.]|uniref:DinB family protein n=1 Tax=Deinococcus sp. TaxID=47478 RepID=UPI003CC5CC5E
MNQSQHYARNFQMHRAALLDLYAQLPEDQGHFRAWDEGMSFIGLADHLSAASERLMATTQGQAAGAPLPASSTLEQARERLSATSDAATQAILKLDDAALSQVISAFGQQMPLSGVLEFAVVHEAHHKGQLWLMARMIGVQPPFFVKQG